MLNCKGVVASTVPWVLLGSRTSVCCGVQWDFWRDICWVSKVILFLQRLGEEIVRISAEICSESRKQEQCVDNRSYESKWNLGIILVSTSIPGLLVFVGYWCYRRGTQRPGTSEPSGGSTPTSPDQRRELAPQQIVEVRASSRIEVLTTCKVPNRGVFR